MQHVLVRVLVEKIILLYPLNVFRASVFAEIIQNENFFKILYSSVMNYFSYE